LRSWLTNKKQIAREHRALHLLSRALHVQEDPLPVRGVAAQERVPSRVVAAAGKGFDSRRLAGRPTAGSF
jgi:hypothetical protein